MGERVEPTYSYEHQQRRSRLLPDAYHQPCPRCGEPMLPGQDLDLGHSVDVAIDPDAKADRIEHASCNRKAGQRLSSRNARFRPSRSW